MRAIEAAIQREQVYSVSEITARMKDLIENKYPSVWIVGEISNHSLHSSGHAYFTLKDEAAQLRCVLFSGSARRISVRLQDGLKVYAQGRITVYPRQGQYELIVSDVLPVGKGELYIAFGRLKEKLEKEGLFDPQRKRKLPSFPSRIALVTSPTGAAVRDVIRTAVKIHAGVEIAVYPVRVQGEGAREEIARAIGELNSIGQFDVIVIARGGGSIEDLWAFNEEVVARAIADSQIPVVSAVGHEIDFTIADFVADARAPTPSAAPTLVLSGYVDVRARLRSLLQRAGAVVSAKIERHGAFLKSLRSHYGLRGLRDRLLSDMRDIDELLARAQGHIVSRIGTERARLSTLAGKAEALSPLATLERGYSICFRQDTREIVKDRGQIDIGDRLYIRFSRGAATAAVEGTEEDIADE
jgi:exodeoxyribonuclease VII large subunit